MATKLICGSSRPSLKRSDHRPCWMPAPATLDLASAAIQQTEPLSRTSPGSGSAPYWKRLPFAGRPKPRWNGRFQSFALASAPCQG